MPVGIIEFLERLEKSNGMVQYNQTRLAAFRYLMEEVVMPFRVDAQFEDQSTKAPPYHNLSAIPAMQIAMYLFEHREEDSAYTALAEELLHFAEDQFVIWERPINKEFFTPCALEQYSYYTPVIGAAAMFMKASSKAFEETQKELYKAKALSLGNAFVVLQETAQGQFPTFCNKGGKVEGWPNVGTYTTSALQYVAEGLKRNRYQCSLLMAWTHLTYMPASKVPRWSCRRNNQKAKESMMNITTLVLTSKKCFSLTRRG